MDAGRRVLQVRHDATQCRGIDAGLIADTCERRQVAIDLLQQLGLDVRARGDGEDVEQALDAGSGIPSLGPRREILDLLEQVLEPQKGADAFVQRMFEDHLARQGKASGAVQKSRGSSLSLS
jgi:hypothetical protein